MRVVALLRRLTKRKTSFKINFHINVICPHAGVAYATKNKVNPTVKSSPVWINKKSAAIMSGSSTASWHQVG